MPKLFAVTQVPFLAASLVAAAAVLTGCAGFTTTASPTNSLGAASGTMTGNIHGGNQPVSNADVRLYAAGTTGYGSVATLYAETSTGSDGSFSFTKTGTAIVSGGTTPVYGCPTASDPQMYVIARGGNTQGAGNGSNAAAAFAIAIGHCSTLTAATFVTMNELTTVATMAALQQYFAPGNATTSGLDQFGMPNTTQAAAGFANGVATLANLVNPTTGVIAANTTTATPTGATAAVTVTITPEAAKINTIADILAACTNTTSSGSTGCTTLFANATPPNSGVTSQPALTLGTATGTLQALYYMLTNPTDGSAANLKNLYALAPAAAPYQPTEAVAPTDWNVALRYTSTSACSAGANFLLYSYHVAIDATGNLYAVSDATGGNLFELSPAGVPLTCALGATIGKSNGFAIDTTGNLWIGSIGATATPNTSIYKYTPGGTTATALATAETAAQVGTQFVSIDGANDVFFSAYTATNTTPSIFDFPAAGTTSQAISAAGTGTAPYFFGADTSKRLFVSNSSGATDFYDLYPSATTTDATYDNGYDTADVGTTASAANIYGVQAGLAGSIATVNGNLAASAVSNALSLYLPTATPGTVTNTFVSAQYAGGLVGPRELAIDGAGNIWSPSSTATSGSYVTGAANAATTYNVAEFSASGAALSPTGTSTSTTTVNGGYQIDPAVLPNAPRGIAVDPSGNVWLGSNSATGTGVTEIVGAAVPVVTPISAALAAGATSTNGVSKP